MIQYLLKNTRGRDFVCGDLHGCFDLLEEALQPLCFDKTIDRLFCVGDLIDRGHDSVKALEYLQKDWFYCIRGNHEQMFLDWCTETMPGTRYENFRMHMQNGGLWVADYLGIHVQDLMETIILEVDITEKFPDLIPWAVALNQLPNAIEIKSSQKTIGLIHAEIPKSINWDALDEELKKPSVLYSTLFSRKYIRAGKNSYRIEGVDEIYCGHTIVLSPQKLGNVNYIDTGAYSNDNLTVIELDN
jgi:serine/threonine protein phosphatase 1